MEGAECDSLIEVQRYESRLDGHTAASADSPGPAGCCGLSDIARCHDRFESVAGDFFDGDPPKADVVVMGKILHDWDEDTKKMLVTKAYDAFD